MMEQFSLDVVSATDYYFIIEQRYQCFFELARFGL